MAATIEIKSNGTVGSVCIDGMDITRRVRAIRYEHTAAELPTLTLEIIAPDVELTSDTIPALPEPFDKWYELKKKMAGFEPRNCAYCGKPFIPQSKRSEKFCRDCRKTGAIKQAIERRDKWERLYWTIYKRTLANDSRKGTEFRFQFSNEHDAVKSRMLSGEITEDEYHNWLIEADKQYRSENKFKEGVSQNE